MKAVKGRCSRFLRSASKHFLARVLLPESNSVGNDSMGSSMICLRNGSVVNSWEGYNGQDRVACKLAGMLSPSIGHLSELHVLSLPFNALSGDVPSETGTPQQAVAYGSLHQYNIIQSMKIMFQVNLI